MTPDDALKDATVAFARQDYAVALALFRRQAHAGDAEAQAWLGACMRTASVCRPL